MKLVLLAAGSSIHTQRWANAFVERGAHVHLVTLHPPLQGLDARVVVHRFPFLQGLGYLLHGPRIARLVSQVNADVVNAHYATGYGSLARWITRVPVVLNVWGSDVFEFPEKGPLHKWFLKRNIHHAVRVVSTSAIMATRVQELIGRGMELTVIPFGVDIERFRPKVRPSPGRTVIFGTMKALEPVYGIDLLVCAFAEAKRLRPALDLRLRIVGQGSQEHVLKALVLEKGIADTVEFVGGIAHHAVPDVLNTLDVFVALSRAESFGVAVIEAAACGLPVIVSDVGGLPDLVDDGISGALVPSGNVQAAAAQMVRFADSAELRRTAGEAGRALVVERYAWPACVDRMMNVLNAAGQRNSRS